MPVENELLGSCRRRRSGGSLLPAFLQRVNLGQWYSSHVGHLTGLRLLLGKLTDGQISHMSYSIM